MKTKEQVYIERLETIIIKWLHACPLTKKEDEIVKKIDEVG
jgi:hypothetical protein